MGTFRFPNEMENLLMTRVGMAFMINIVRDLLYRKVT